MVEGKALSPEIGGKRKAKKKGERAQGN